MNRGGRALDLVPTYTRAFDSLPPSIREAVERKVDEMGRRLESFPHQRLQGRREFKLRVGDYRVLYEFDIGEGRIFLHYVGNRREADVTIPTKSPAQAARTKANGQPFAFFIGAWR